MIMKHSLRRIASLSAFLLAAGIASASQAGIIPWVYDAIFGPVHYRGYGSGCSPCAVSYARPVVIRSSYGCSPCAVSYCVPVSTRASNGCGSCGPIAMGPSCGPCGVTYASASGCLSGCSVAPASATTTNGKATWNSTKKNGEPSPDPAPAPRTFQGPDREASPAGATTTDGLSTSPRTRGSRSDSGTNQEQEVEVKKAPEAADEPTILNRKKAPAKTTDDLFDTEAPKTPAKPADDQFQPPVKTKEPATEVKPENTDSTIRLPLSPLNLDAKIVWRVEPLRSRVPLHAKIAKASATRRSTINESDWTPIVAKSAGTHVARK